MGIIELQCCNCYHLVSEISSKFQSFMTILNYMNVRTNFVSIIDIWMNYKVSWDDNTCKLFHKKCQYKSYHNDIKYHMTLNTIFSVVSNSHKCNEHETMLLVEMKVWVTTMTTTCLKHIL